MNPRNSETSQRSELSQYSAFGILGELAPLGRLAIPRVHAARVMEASAKTPLGPRLEPGRGRDRSLRARLCFELAGTEARHIVRPAHPTAIGIAASLATDHLPEREGQARWGQGDPVRPFGQPDCQP